MAKLSVEEAINTLVECQIRTVDAMELMAAMIERQQTLSIEILSLLDRRSPLLSATSQTEQQSAEAPTYQP